MNSRMQKRLSARKGYTTTRLLVKNLILIDDLKDFFRSLQLTDDLPRILATRTDTRPAVLTLAWDLLHPASVMMKLDCFVDAVGDTPPAAGAFIADNTSAADKDRWFPDWHTICIPWNIP